MANAKTKLADQVQDIVTDALDTISRMVRDSLNDELKKFLAGKAQGGAVAPKAKKSKGKAAKKTAAKAGKKAGGKLAKKAGKKVAKKGARKAAGKPAKKAAKKATKKAPAKARKFDAAAAMEALVKLVGEKGEIAPKAARKFLKLSGVQMQGLAREASRAGKIKVDGKGRGTRYVKI